MTNAFSKLLVVVALVALSHQTLSAQVAATQTVTTTNGAFTEFVPSSRMVVVRTESQPVPIQYAVTEKTVVVNAAGEPVAIETLSSGAPIAVEYVPGGDRIVASRIVVQQPAVRTVPVTVAPGTVVKENTTTTTTTTRKLSEDEIEEREEAREEAADKRD